MVNFPTQAELSELANFRGSRSLTLYVPFIDPNSATNPNRIVLKNLLAEAEQALIADGLSLKDTIKTLRPAHDLLDTDEFWPPRHESLAFFAHKKLFHYFHVPTGSVPELLHVGKGFELEPLERAMQDNKQYYVLALSHKHVRLYEGDHYQLKPVKLDNFPSDMKTALNIDEYPHSRQTHTISPSSKGRANSSERGAEGHHDHAEVTNTDKDMLLEFFRHIDKYLHKTLNKKRLPLVIGGVNYLLPIYRKANTYPGLFPSAITGNLDRSDLPTIRTKAWSLISS